MKSIILALGLAAAAYGAPPVNGRWELTLRDEFDGTALDRKVWDVESGSPGHILSSRWPENIEVRDGVCRLITKKEQRGGKDWTTAHFWTKDFRQKYGYYEARMRYGKATGLNNAFWLMTRTAEKDPAHRFELDINEGHFPSDVAMNIHQWKGEHWSKGGHWYSTLDLSQDFHVYGFEWNEKELVWYLDGEVIRRAANEIAFGDVPVIFSTAVLKWAGEITDKLDGASMDVDYVRVYKRTDKPSEPPALDFGTMLRPVPASAKFQDPGYYTWCGSMTKSDDGKYHLFYSRWPLKLGFLAWVTHSEIAHAVADSAQGPFKFADVVLPARGKQFWDGLCTHNPTIQRYGGRYYLYYMGNTGDGVGMKTLNWVHRNNQRIGVAVANTPSGPWKRLDKPVMDVSTDAGAPDALMVSNPSVTQRADGTYLMIYKAVGKQRAMPFGGPVVHLTATAKSPTGPFTKQLKPIFLAAGVDFPAEDPFIWYDAERTRYFAIVKDFKGHFTKAGRSLALWESGDGFDWKLAEHALVATLEVEWAGGRKQKLNSLERPQLLFEKGRPTVLLAAANEDGAREFSYNLQIPLGPREARSRQGLPNVIAKLEAGGPVRVAYLGGSITEAEGWRVLTTKWLGEKYPKAKVEEIHAAISGTGSNYGVFRLQRDVLRRRPDLLFVEFAVNDGGYSTRVLRAMEGIVRETWKANPRTDICFVYTLSHNDLAKLQAGYFNGAARAAEEVAERYGIPSIHLAMEVARLVEEERVVFKGAKDSAPGKVVFSPDGVHPYTDVGHPYYLAAIARAWPQFKGVAAERVLPAPLDAANWEGARTVAFSEVQHSGNWRRLEPQDPVARQVARRMPEVWKADQAGDALTFRFRGRVFGIDSIKGPDVGKLRITVDVREPVVATLFDSFCAADRWRIKPWVSEELPEGEHAVRIEIMQELPDKSAVGKGAQFEERALYVAGVFVLGNLLP